MKTNKAFSRRKYHVDDNFFDEMNDIQYWMLGLFASDGYVWGNNALLSQSGDAGLKLVEYTRDLLHCTAPISSKKPDIGQEVHRIQFSSEKITNVFKQFGIVQNKTKVFCMPDIPDHYLPSFLAGYVEGDGCITISKYDHATDMLCASFVGNKDFIEECARKIPVKGKVRKHSMSDIYEIRWYSEKAIQFCEWIYGSAELYHSYKYENYINGKELYGNSRYAKSKALQEKIIADYNSGLFNTGKECADKYGLREQTVFRWLKKWLENGLINRDYHIVRVMPA